MKKVKLAIVGRPNVGKSSIFNHICKKRIAIAHEEEGVTRDRIYGTAEFFGTDLTMIDTGGIDTKSDMPFKEEVKNQALLAIEEADGIIMVVDVRIGLTTLDEEVSALLLKSKKPLVLAVNKVDGYRDEALVHEFAKFGIEKVMPVSAIQGSGFAELLEGVLENISLIEEEEQEDKAIRVAIVGRANVGKSTLLNHIFKEDRAIVSPTAGTTRDAIDARIEVDGKEYVFVDTAGIRRKKSEKHVVEKFAAMRTKNAIDDADICLLILDSREGMTTEEKRIARMIEDEGKGCILLFNKWDLVKDFRMEHCLTAIRQEVSFLEHCPAHFISAKSGRNCEGLFTEIDNVFAAVNKRVSTGELNRFLEKSMQRVHPPLITGKRLRVYYLTQVSSHPAKFVFFVNYPDLLAPTYKKYLINEFRKTFTFSGAPLHFRVRKKEVSKERLDRIKAMRSKTKSKKTKR